MEEKYNFSISFKAYQLIRKGLGNLPHDQVNHIIIDLQNQVKEIAKKEMEEKQEELNK